MHKAKTILMAEDNAHDALMTLMALSQQHLSHEVVIVRDGAEALDFLYCKKNFREREPGDPAAILLDVVMPKQNGIQVLQHIKRDQKLKNIPVVMLAASHAEQQMIGNYKFGVSACIVKTVDLNDFNKAIQGLSSFWAGLNDSSCTQSCLGLVEA